jgi:cell division protein FtsB
MSLVLLASALLVVASVAFVYLTGRERRGWAARLDRERNAATVERRELIAKIRRLEADNKRLAAENETYTSENVVLARRADNAERSLVYLGNRG